LTDFVHCCVGKLGLRTTKPIACRLALNKIASNLGSIIEEFPALTLLLEVANAYSAG
jgi:hypothetical protein